nr:MAG TPA: hypothetical protein [Crassvirales sp.]
MYKLNNKPKRSSTFKVLFLILLVYSTWTY